MTDPALRQNLERAVEMLIAILDSLEPDPDFEPDADSEDGHDLEDDRADFEPDRDGEGESERESQWQVPDNAGVPV